MKKIPSFTIDHIHLLRGIYVSRKDYLGDHVVTKSYSGAQWGAVQEIIS